ncbi:MAG: hypothetical protein KatS3mg095_0633 [Candidatus Parcubacteria bacterium]|nr:MAG: hypothetical protein KatS3mg095_0633 [Candidatus Parcubacteria bacterium]
MICYYQLLFKNKQEEFVIEFGVPDNKEELKKMFQLRFEVYAQKNYIDPQKFPDGLEQDEYDFNKKCVYFISKIEDEVIGSLRLIIDNPLPTQIYFKFQEPLELSIISDNQKLEIGRLVIKYHPLYKKIKLGRHLILLTLFKSVMDYASEKQYLAGYSFIKKRLADKLNILSLPYHEIKNFEQVYPDNGILAKYFNDLNDPVIPIFYLKNEVNNYLNKLFNKKFLFKTIKNNNHTTIKVNNLNYNLYIKYLYIKSI